MRPSSLAPLGLIFIVLFYFYSTSVSELRFLFILGQCQGVNRQHTVVNLLMFMLGRHQSCVIHQTLFFRRL